MLNIFLLLPTLNPYKLANKVWLQNKKMYLTVLTGLPHEELAEDEGLAAGAVTLTVSVTQLQQADLKIFVDEYA